MKIDIFDGFIECRPIVLRIKVYEKLPEYYSEPRYSNQTYPPEKFAKRYTYFGKEFYPPKDEYYERSERCEYIVIEYGVERKVEKEEFQNLVYKAFGTKFKYFKNICDIFVPIVDKAEEEKIDEELVIIKNKLKEKLRNDRLNKKVKRQLVIHQTIRAK